MSLRCPTIPFPTDPRVPDTPSGGPALVPDTTLPPTGTRIARKGYDQGTEGVKGVVWAEGGFKKFINSK